MLNTQAAISTIFFLVMLTVIGFGAMFMLYHKWVPARIAGGIVAALGIVGFVSHLVFLIVGA